MHDAVRQRAQSTLEQDQRGYDLQSVSSRQHAADWLVQDVVHISLLEHDIREVLEKSRTFPYFSISLHLNKCNLSIFFLKEQAAAAPIYLATIDKISLSKESFYWNGLTEGTASPDANSAVLAYRLWEISETILAERTSAYDTFFDKKDQFSSIFEREKDDDDKSTSSIYF